MYRVVVCISLRPSILDPQGKAIRHALHDLGQHSIESVRVGKRIELMVDAEDEAAASQIAERASDMLLANAVMEDFAIESVESVGEPA